MALARTTSSAKYGAAARVRSRWASGPSSGIHVVSSRAFFGPRDRVQVIGGRKAPLVVVVVEATVVAKVIVEITDQHVENDPPQKFVQVFRRRARIDPDDFCDFGVGRFVAVGEPKSRHGGSEGDSPASIDRARRC